MCCHLPGDLRANHVENVVWKIQASPSHWYRGSYRGPVLDLHCCLHGKLRTEQAGAEEHEPQAYAVAPCYHRLVCDLGQVIYPTLLI